MINQTITKQGQIPFPDNVDISDLFDQLKNQLINQHERELQERDNFTQQLVLELNEAYCRIDTYKNRIGQLVKIVNLMKTSCDYIQVQS